MLATLGDLIDDVVVHLAGPIRFASDTEAHIAHRRGGSAANVAAAAAGLGVPVRFLGQVGDDPTGRALVAELASDGVDTRHVRRHGATGSIVVLVDADGERTMLTDRGACVALDAPSSAWLDDVTVLHVPLYSFDVEPLATTARTLAVWSRERGVALSIDASSTAVVERIGPAAVRSFLGELAVDYLFANRDEAAALGISAAVGDAVTVVKRGADPVAVFAPDGSGFETPATPLGRPVDTTGAGDAFAAGFLVAVGAGADLTTAARRGCDTAHRLLAGR